jgi:hypothetical protein
MQRLEEEQRGAAEARWSRIDTELCAALALAALAVRLPELLTPRPSAMNWPRWYAGCTSIAA